MIVKKMILKKMIFNGCFLVGSIIFFHITKLPKLVLILSTAQTDLTEYFWVNSFIFKTIPGIFTKDLGQRYNNTIEWSKSNSMRVFVFCYLRIHILIFIKNLDQKNILMLSNGLSLSQCDLLYINQIVISLTSKLRVQKSAFEK